MPLLWLGVYSSGVSIRTPIGYQKPTLLNGEQIHETMLMWVRFLLRFGGWLVRVAGMGQSDGDCVRRNAGLQRDGGEAREHKVWLGGNRGDPTGQEQGPRQRALARSTFVTLKHVHFLSHNPCPYRNTASRGNTRCFVNQPISKHIIAMFWSFRLLPSLFPSAVDHVSALPVFQDKRTVTPILSSSVCA